MTEKLGKNDTELEIDGVSYWAEYEYGRDWTDAPEEREFAWVEVVDCKAFDKDDKPVATARGHEQVIEEHCLKEACEILALPY